MARNTQKNMKIDFNDGIEPSLDFYHGEKIISDRGSLYSVSLGCVHTKEDIQAFIKKTKQLKNHHKASHHTWAVRIGRQGVVYESKNDGGETGAGQIILRMLQKKNLINTIICVTRWYGGVKLESDRFKHVQDASLHAIDTVFKN